MRRNWQLALLLVALLVCALGGARAENDAEEDEVDSVSDNAPVGVLPKARGSASRATATVAPAATSTSTAAATTSTTTAAASKTSKAGKTGQTGTKKSRKSRSRKSRKSRKSRSNKSGSRKTRKSGSKSRRAPKPSKEAVAAKRATKAAAAQKAKVDLLKVKLSMADDSEKAALKLQLKAAQRAQARLAQKVADAQQVRVAKLVASVAQLKERAQSLTGPKKALVQKKIAKQQVAAEKAKVAASKAKLVVLKAKVATATGERKEKLVKQVAARKQKVAAAKTRLASTKKIAAVAAQKAKIAQLKVKLSTATPAEKAAIKRQLKTAQRAQARLAQKVVVAHQKRAAKLVARVAALQDKVQSLTGAKRAAVQKKIAAAQVAAQKAKISASKAKVDVLKAKMATATGARKEKLRAKLAARKQKIAAAKVKLAAKKAALKAASKKARKMAKQSKKAHKMAKHHSASKRAAHADSHAHSHSDSHAHADSHEHAHAHAHASIATVHAALAHKQAAERELLHESQRLYELELARKAARKTAHAAAVKAAHKAAAAVGPHYDAHAFEAEDREFDELTGVNDLALHDDAEDAQVAAIFEDLGDDVDTTHGQCAVNDKIVASMADLLPRLAALRDRALAADAKSSVREMALAQARALKKSVSATLLRLRRKYDGVRTSLVNTRFPDVSALEHEIERLQHKQAVERKFNIDEDRAHFIAAKIARKQREIRELEAAVEARRVRLATRAQCLDRMFAAIRALAIESLPKVCRSEQLTAAQALMHEVRASRRAQLLVKTSKARTRFVTAQLAVRQQLDAMAHKMAALRVEADGVRGGARAQVAVRLHCVERLTDAMLASVA